MLPFVSVLVGLGLLAYVGVVVEWRRRRRGFRTRALMDPHDWFLRYARFAIPHCAALRELLAALAIEIGVDDWTRFRPDDSFSEHYQVRLDSEDYAGLDGFVEYHAEWCMRHGLSIEHWAPAGERLIDLLEEACRLLGADCVTEAMPAREN